MNYSHIYHAGNFADILKHSLLSMIMAMLQKRHKKIFVLDTHAGRGRYNLLSPEATRSKEAKNGILNLLKTPSPTRPDFIARYIDIIQGFNPPQSPLHIYPGSPAIIHKQLREKDRAAFCELNEKEFFKLHGLFHGDKNIKTIRGDGYEALLSFLPPKENQGLVLIDPPFEKKEEMQTLEKTIVKSVHKWPQGTFVLWYPIKNGISFSEHYQFLQSNCDAKFDLFTLKIPSRLTLKQTSLKETAIIVINAPEDLSFITPQVQALENLIAQEASEGIALLSAP